MSLGIFMLALAAGAAPIKNVNCRDYMNVTDTLRPVYLASIEGYNQSGKKVFESVDLGGIVSESENVTEKCKARPTASLSDVRKTTKTTTTEPKFNVKNSTCQDFLALGDDVQPVAAYYAAGYDKAGKFMGGAIETAYVNQPVDALVEVCKAEPKASFLSKAKTWVKTHL